MLHASPTPKTQGYNQVGQQGGQPKGHRTLGACPETYGTRSPSARAEVLETSEAAAAATQGN